MNASTPLRQALAIQQSLVTTIKSPDTKPFDRAQCARSWAEIEDCKRRMRREPELRPVSIEELRRLRGDGIKNVLGQGNPAHIMMIEDPEPPPPAPHETLGNS